MHPESLTSSVGDVPMLVGEQRPAGDGEWIDVSNPYSGTSWARVPQASDAEVDRAVVAAREAFDAGPWSTWTGQARSAVLHRFADLVRDNAAELTALQVMENGKAIREQSAQTNGLVGHLRFFAGVAEDMRGTTIPFGNDDLIYTAREPLGVVAALTPWNSPLSLLMWKLAPALAAGNVMVVKPSEVSPVSTIRLAELALEAGLPPGVLNVVTGDARTGAALAGHPGVDKVAFTGSTAAGQAVSRLTAETLAKTSLELGGKSANIVFADAHLDAAIEGVVGGIFAAAGQTCVAGSRVLVQDEIYDEFVERLVARTATIKLGDPMDWDTEVGTMSGPRQYDTVLSYISIGVEEGARVLAGGGPAEDPLLSPGLFVAPTVLEVPSPDMRVAQEEIFGPVACVLRFSTDDDAVAVANSTPFGLAAGVWTRDVGRAHAVSRRLRAGTVWINTYRKTSYLAPFGGTGFSGIGRENGRDAVEDYSEVKTVWLNLSDRIQDPFNPFA
jgi:(Z)-2-((N-methylformamido)methylene)-5-hydroxybutyrolactone dehydrogenase